MWNVLSTPARHGPLGRHSGSRKTWGGWYKTTLVLRNVLEKPLLLIDYLCVTAARSLVWWHNAFILHFLEHTNRGAYISVVFDVRQTIRSPQDWLPIQSANGKRTLQPPVCCLPPPPFSCSTTFTAADSAPCYNGLAIRATFIGCEQVSGIIFGHSYSC